MRPPLSTAETTQMGAALNALGRERTPAFGVAVFAEQQGKEIKHVYIEIACHPATALPAAVHRIAEEVIATLSRGGRGGTVGLGTASVRLVPGATAQTVAAASARLAAAIAAPTAGCPESPDWPDPQASAGGFRRFVAALTGLTVEGIVETRDDGHDEIFIGQCAAGSLYLIAEQGGWNLALVPAAAEAATRVWQTVPTPESLVQALSLDWHLGAEPPGVDPRFRSMEFDMLAAVERKRFDTTIGPVVVHTRRLHPDLPVELVVQVERQGRIFALDAPGGSVIEDGNLRRRELSALPF